MLLVQVMNSAIKVRHATLQPKNAQHGLLLELHAQLQIQILADLDLTVVQHYLRLLPCVLPLLLLTMEFCLLLFKVQFHPIIIKYVRIGEWEAMENAKLLRKLKMVLMQNVPLMPIALEMQQLLHLLENADAHFETKKVKEYVDKWLEIEEALIH